MEKAEILERIENVLRADISALQKSEDQKYIQNYWEALHPESKGKAVLSEKRKGEAKAKPRSIGGKFKKKQDVATPSPHTAPTAPCGTTPPATDISKPPTAIDSTEPVPTEPGGRALAVLQAPVSMGIRLSEISEFYGGGQSPGISGRVVVAPASPAALQSPGCLAGTCIPTSRY